MSATSSFDPWKAIPRDEFVSRQRWVRDRLERESLDAALVWSKGGAFMDMSADVLYLTNHYSQYPYVGDEHGLGSGRGHAAVLIPRKGPTQLVADAGFWNAELVVADRVRTSSRVPETLAESVKEAGLERGRLAFVGMGYMTATSFLRLREELAEAELIRCDRLIEDRRIYKTSAELEVIRRASELGDAAIDVLLSHVVPGNTEASAVAEAARVITAGGGVLYDAACASGPWSQHFTYARLPSADTTRPFQLGDLFHVDCYGCYGGYFFDLARSRVVGDAPSPEQLDLLNAVIDGVHTVCDAIEPGLTGRELHEVGSRWVASSGFVQSRLGNVVGGGTTSRSGIGLDQDPESGGILSFGHGIGLGWERPWMVSHEATTIEPNMYLAVEVLLADPSVGGAMFENAGIVTDDGFEVLSGARETWW